MARATAPTRRRDSDRWPVLKPGAADGWFAFVVLASRLPLMLVGMAGAGIMILAAIVMAILRPQQFGATWSRAWVIWLFPLLALLSTAWAVYPGVTARAAVQTLFTVLAGLMIGKSPRPYTTLIGLFVAYVGYTVASLFANVQQGVGTFGGIGVEGSALVGIGGEAKNFFSESAITGMLLSLTLLWGGLGKVRLPVLAVLAACAFACGLATVRAHSGGALISGAVGVAALIGTLLLRRLPPTAKILAIVGVGIALILGAVFYDQIIGAAAAALRKNPGLTGRDYLWFHSIEQIRARPILGMGYYGFWHPANPDAIGLGRYFDLPETTSAFSFHNAYIQTLVELGYVGLAVLLVGWIAGAVGLLRRLALSNSIPACFWFAYFCAEMTKSGVELIRPATLVAPTIMLSAALAFGLSPVTDTPRPVWRRRPRRDRPAMRRDAVQPIG
jgi:exopolysaccharide production protein ExoQ